MKILFLVASLRGGGAERVASTLCNYWSESGYEVVLVTFDEPVNDFYQSHANIKRHSLACFKTSQNKLEKIKSNLYRIANLRKIVKQEHPDVVVSFLDVANILAIVACAFLSVKVIVSERTYPPYFNHNNLFDRVRKFVYKFADAFVAQTGNVAQWAKQFLPARKVCVIANPIKRYVAEIGSFERENVILTVGRLGHEKGYDLLIQAFAKIHDKYPAWKLKIVGEGAYREFLEQQIVQSNLQGRVLLPGQSERPEDEYARAKIFVLSSRVEGFPNVLIEAMAHGMAAISFNCNSGPADIIADGVNGILIDPLHVEQLSLAMQKLIEDEDYASRLGAAAKKTVQKYRLENISAQWIHLLQAGS